MAPPLALTVVVLGDIGRSPRMQFHALSWVRKGQAVAIVGLEGEPPAHGLEPFAVALADAKVPGPWVLAAPLRYQCILARVRAHALTRRKGL